MELVSNLKKGEELSHRELTEAEIEAIEQGIADSKAGRTTPHEEVMKEVNQWLNDMTLKQIKEDILDLPVEMRADIVAYILKSLSIDLDAGKEKYNRYVIKKIETALNSTGEKISHEKIKEEFLDSD